MYLSNNLKWKWWTDLETDKIDCIWVEGKTFKGENFLVDCMYGPQDSSSYLQKDFNKNLNKMLTKINNKSVDMFLLGVININYLVKSSHKEIKELFMTHRLPQLVKLPPCVTQETKFLIDVIMTNRPSKSLTIEFEWSWLCYVCT